MSISGNLKTMELAELLQWVAQGQKTGTLIIDSGTVNKKVFFEEGQIVASGSTEKRVASGRWRRWFDAVWTRTIAVSLPRT